MFLFSIMKTHTSKNGRYIYYDIISLFSSYGNHIKLKLIAKFVILRRLNKLISI